MFSSTKQKTKRIKAMRPKLRLFRAKEPLFSVFMWGINHSISQLSHVSIPVMLMPDDFKAYTKARVDNYMFNKENMPSHFKFKEYCPIVFRNLRERFNIDESKYLKSLTKDCPYDLESVGRTGGRLLLSYDRRLFIKTIQTEQVAEIHRILKDYHQHVVEHHADTLLPQYLGMYRVTIADSETYLIVSRNIFSPRLNIHKKFDLKGSKVARQAKEKEKAKDHPTYKDNDFLNEGRSIQIGPERRNKLMQTLQADTDFLSRLNLMDYSLLVGIHDCDFDEEENHGDSFDNDGENEEEDEELAETGNGSMTPPDSPVVLSPPPMFVGDLDPNLELYAIKCSEFCPRHEIYFIAFINILTRYGVKKRTAQAAKTVKHGTGAEISTVAPDQYARRFLEFIEKIVE